MKRPSTGAQGGQQAKKRSSSALSGPALRSGTRSQVPRSSGGVSKTPATPGTSTPSSRPSRATSKAPPKAPSSLAAASKKRAASARQPGRAAPSSPPPRTLKAAEAKIARIEEELADAHNRIAKVESDMAFYRNDAEEVVGNWEEYWKAEKREKEKFQKKAKEFSKKLDLAKKEIEEQKAKEAELGEQKKLLEAKLAEMTATIAKLEDDGARREAEMGVEKKKVDESLKTAEAEVQALRQQLQESETTAAAKDAQTTAMVSEMCAAVAKMEAGFGVQERQVVELEKAVKTGEAEIKALHQKLQQTEDAKATLAAYEAQLVKQKKQLEARNATMTATIAKLEDDCARRETLLNKTLKAAQDGVEASLQLLQKSEKAKTTLAAELETLKAKIEKVPELESKLEASRGNQVELEKQIEKFQEDLQAKDVKLAQMEAQKGTLEQEKAMLGSRLVEEAAKVSSSEKNLAALTAEAASLRKANINLDAVRIAADLKKAELEKALSDANESKKALESQALNWASEWSKANKVIETIETKLGGCEAALKKEEEKSSAAASELKSAQEALRAQEAKAAELARNLNEANGVIAEKDERIREMSEDFAEKHANFCKSLTILADDLKEQKLQVSIHTGHISTLQGSLANREELLGRIRKQKKNLQTEIADQKARLEHNEAHPLVREHLDTLGMHERTIALYRDLIWVLNTAEFRPVEQRAQLEQQLTQRALAVHETDSNQLHLLLSSLHATHTARFECWTRLIAAVNGPLGPLVPPVAAVPASVVCPVPFQAPPLFANPAMMQAFVANLARARLPGPLLPPFPASFPVPQAHLPAPFPVPLAPLPAPLPVRLQAPLPAPQAPQ